MCTLSSSKILGGMVTRAGIVGAQGWHVSAGKDQNHSSDLRIGASHCNLFLLSVGLLITSDSSDCYLITEWNTISFCVCTDWNGNIISSILNNGATDMWMWDV